MITVSGKMVNRGRFCRFWKLDDNIGVKVYKTQAQAIENMVDQIKASKHNLGPAVYSDVERVVNDHNRVIGYGYLTQLVRMCDKNEFNPTIEKRLQDRYYKVFGYPNNDVWNENVGFIGNRAVLIDFGAE